MNAVPKAGNQPNVRRMSASLLQMAAVATAYVVTARMGLSLDAVGGFATVVWPASGIALAAILLGGTRLWPAVALGAFVANVLTGAPYAAAAGIAFGNTAEALVGCYLLQRVPGFRTQLDRVRDVLAMIVLAAGLSTIVAATLGVLTLYVSGILQSSQMASAWKAWWIGDSIGDLIAAPFILVWAAWRPRVRTARMSESLALGLLIVMNGMVVFAGAPAAGSVIRGREYLLFPPLIWASLRFRTRGAVTSTLIVTVVAVVYTVYGKGPFIRGGLHDNLLALQLFTGVTAATFLLLGASIAERYKTARDLDAARQMAEIANRAKANFLGVMSHELRTPLNAMMGYVELLLMQIDSPLSSAQREILERIQQSQRHLLSLVEDVLGFAQVEAGRLSFILQPVTLRETFNAIGHLVGNEARKKSIELKVANLDSSLQVTADPDKLRQTLLNLVSNALKFTSQGGTIELLAALDGDMVKIEVRDTGIGILPENLNRVFEPFFQVDQGGTRKYPGVGLGLSIVRDAVLAMNGDVEINSEPGKGTTVCVVFPRASAASAPADAFTTGESRVSRIDS